tara:strand:- start:82 stop:537 length:456 start_codon:yes stop_codon:yes gene_type:complete
MKNLIYLILPFCLIVFSCSKDNDDIKTNVAETNQLITIVQSGDWIITDFKENGIDGTANFEGFIFNFEEDNILTATSSTSTVSGTWRISHDSASDDDPGDDTDFNIFFNSPEEFTDLTNDWDVVSASASQMVLIHISGGSVETDNLTLTKN